MEFSFMVIVVAIATHINGLPLEMNGYADDEKSGEDRRDEVLEDIFSSAPSRDFDNEPYAKLQSRDYLRNALSSRVARNTPKEDDGPFDIWKRLEWLNNHGTLNGVGSTNNRWGRSTESKRETGYILDNVLDWASKNGVNRNTTPRMRRFGKRMDSSLLHRIELLNKNANTDNRSFHNRFGRMHNSPWPVAYRKRVWSVDYVNALAAKMGTDKTSGVTRWRRGTTE